MNYGVTTLSALKFNSKEFESCFIEIPLRNGDNLLVGSLYRPPNTDIEKFIEEYNDVMCKIKKKNYTYTVLGMDHNLDFLKCHIHKGTEKFIQTNLDYMMIPTITRPTRITHTSATLIDNILVSQNLCGAFYSGIIPNDMSDHLPSVCVLYSVQCPRKAPVTICSRDTRRKNLDNLKVELACTNWQQVLLNEDIDTNLENLHEYLQEKLNKHVPEREFELKGKKGKKREVGDSRAPEIH